MNPTPYCFHPFSYQRRKTREVKVGAIGIGGSNPIRVQSMTTSDTMNTEATVKETIEMFNAGCEIVRITAPTTKDAQNIKNIRAELRRQNILVPLVADIHFLPSAAMEAVNHVDKIRVNPGNYADKKKFAIREYSDNQYNEELARIHEAFSPLVKRCIELGVAMRIGTNHGSLSDRIMNRYGDTPLGMVESALEFVRICRDHNYHEIVLSMKASNPKVMIQAYRLLAQRLGEFNWDYPFHLGVTEAGDGEDGRIKSAIGIGSLLDDGIGDTIRVSLTEDSVYEIPVAQAIAKKYNEGHGPVAKIDLGKLDLKDIRNPYEYSRRKSREVTIGDLAIGHSETICVEIPLDLHAADLEKKIFEVTRGGGDIIAEIIQFQAKNASDLEKIQDLRSEEGSAAGSNLFSINIGSNAALAAQLPIGIAEKIIFEPADSRGETAMGWTAAQFDKLIDYAQTNEASLQINLSDNNSHHGKTFFERCRDKGFFEIIVGIGQTENVGLVQGYRILASYLSNLGVDYPIHLRNVKPSQTRSTDDSLLLESASNIGGLLCDGIGDSVEVSGPTAKEALRWAYNILQGTGNRITKTEYVSCPSCGRTLFNLQSTTERIKQKTAHLKGVKVAIMGCIVNGPGEMADADFGYVGGAPGKVNLYVGKECVQYHVPEAEADQRLIDLIKSHGKWVDPENASSAKSTTA